MFKRIRIKILLLAVLVLLTPTIIHACEMVMDCRIMGVCQARDPNHYPEQVGCAFIDAQFPRDSPFFSLNLTPYNQFNASDSVENGSCGPTSAASLLDYVNRTWYPGLTKGFNKSALIDHLAELMNTTTNGTKSDAILVGIIKFLYNHSLYENFTFIFYQPDYFKIGGNRSYPPWFTTTIGDYIPQLIVFKWINGAANYTNIYDELVVHNRLIVLTMKANYTDGIFNYSLDHAMAVDNIDNVPDAQGWYNISFMDPAEGAIIYAKIRNGTVSFGEINATLRTMEIFGKKGQ